MPIYAMVIQLNWLYDSDDRKSQENVHGRSQCSTGANTNRWSIVDDLFEGFLHPIVNSTMASEEHYYHLHNLSVSFFRWILEINY